MVCKAEGNTSSVKTAADQTVRAVETVKPKWPGVTTMEMLGQQWQGICVDAGSKGTCFTHILCCLSTVPGVSFYVLASKDNQ